MPDLSQFSGGRELRAMEITSDPVLSESYKKPTPRRAEDDETAVGGFASAGPGASRDAKTEFAAAPGVMSSTGVTYSEREVEDKVKGLVEILKKAKTRNCRQALWITE